MKRNVNLPIEFRICEGCVHFEALFWGRKLKCRRLGTVSDGVVVCTYKKGGTHAAGRTDRRPGPDGHPDRPDRDVDRGQT